MTNWHKGIQLEEQTEELINQKDYLFHGVQWKRHEHVGGGKWWNGNNEAVYAWEPYLFFYVVDCSVEMEREVFEVWAKLWVFNIVGMENAEEGDQDR